MDINKFLNKTKSVKAVTLSDGDIVHIKKISVAEMESLQAAKDSGLARSLVASLCDEKGNAVFSVKDIPQLNQLEFGYVTEILTAIKEFNGLRTEVEAKKN